MQQQTMAMVTEFNEILAPEQIRSTPGICEQKCFDFRFDFMNEEIDETRAKGLAMNDIIEIADGLGDIRYVLYGMVLNFGLEGYMLEPQALINYNMQPGYYLDVIKHELDYIYKLYHKNNLSRIAIGIANIDMLLDQAEKAAGLTDVMPAVIAEIHRSNMTKCTADRKLADDSCLVLHEEHGICTVYPVQDKFVVRRFSDAKIMKPIGYEKPNLEEVIRQHRAENPIIVNN